MTIKNDLKPLISTFFIISIVQSMYFLFSSRNLRPIADDYCFAYRAGLGFSESFSVWFMTWTSDTVSILTNYFLVGFPLVYFPYSIASATGFLAASLSVAFTLYYITFKKFSLIKFFLFYSVVLISYLSFWRVNSVFLENSIFKRLSNMILHWQNINSQYIFLTSIALLFLFIVIHTEKSGLKSYVLLLAYGFLVGSSGIVLGLSVIAVLLIYLFYFVLQKKQNEKINIFVSILGIFIGLAFSFFGPGTQARSKILENNPSRQDINLLNLFSWTFPKSIVEWLQGFFHLGGLIALLLGFLLGIVLKQVHGLRGINELWSFARIILLFSLIAAILSQLSEAFAYVAFWHLAVPYVLSFILLFISGILAATSRSKKITMTKMYALSAITGLLLGISGLTVYFAVTDINERKLKWQFGPAPVEGISDIENKEDWVFGCWMGMKEYKGYPDRENF